MTGLSGSGKTSIAKMVELLLSKENISCKVLDGDEIRKGLNSDLTYSIEDRKENIRRVAELNRIFLKSGFVCINCFISPTKEIRSLAKNIIGASNFQEIFVDASLNTCEKRDVKGHYKKARKGEIPDFTGIDSPFEIPENPDLVINTEREDLESSAQQLYTLIK